MSEVKLISPLLDNFDIGDSISMHDGVCCYPAIHKGTNDKYIVKVISIPATRTQLDALLLTGACHDEQSALAYFKELADDIGKEVQTLHQLSRLEGFLPYDGWQIVPMADGTGYQVYLLSTYKRTLEKQFARQPLTHLSAVNLGLDLCASLAVCRRSGYLHVDLKPSNIYITDDKEYRIGDLGFVRLDSLIYAALPDKYRSSYTAPELSDPFSTLNATVDIYAVGLILYQVYNNGILPVPTADGTIQPPEYADYEMAEIILKACAQDPAERWQEPIQMGQALVNYMQRNCVNDTPIIPIPTAETEEPVDDALVDESCNQESVSDDSTDSAELHTLVCDDDVEDPNSAEQDCRIEEDSIALVSAQAAIDTNPEFHFLSDNDDETDPGNFTEEITFNEVSDELNEILAQVDELVSLDVPAPVIAPEPIEVDFEPIITDAPEANDPVELADSLPSEDCDTDIEQQEVIPEEAVLPKEFEPLESLPEIFSTEESHEQQEEEIIALPKKKRGKGLLIGAVILLALLAVIAAGIFYYQNFYLMPINAIKLEGNEDFLIVLVDTGVDESLLKVVCSDSHGNQTTLPVINGKTTFENLVPNTAYSIKVVSEGFHRLTGNVAAAYSTPAQTNIVQFSAVTGAEDGSAILGFTVEGPDDGQWYVVYSAPGESEQMVTFPSHMVTLTGLTLGKDYTFRLVSDSDLYVTGINEITFRASKLVYAEDLLITGFVDGKLTVTWKAPEHTSIDHWTVRCYDDSNYNETIITSETAVTFSALEQGHNYTVEVTAAGMSVSQRTFVAKNALTAFDFYADNSDPNKLTVTWNTNAKDNSDGWMLLYTVDNGEKQISVPCSNNSAVIKGIVPGAEYNFTLQDAAGTPVLSEPFSYSVPEAEIFSGYSVTAENMTFRLYQAPDIVYTNTFISSDSIYMKINLNKRYSSSDDRITILFATRNSDGAVINSSTTTLLWNNLWTSRECILAIPYTPEDVGEYTICIYFNGQLITEQPYTIKNAAD